MFTENQHLVNFSPIMKVSFQRTKRGDFYTHYFIRVLAYVLNFKTFSIIWRLSSWKTIIPQISLIRVLDHFLINNMHLKLLFRMYLKEMFLLSCRSWEVLRFKFEKSFKNYLVINWRLVIWKLFLCHPLELKAFPPSTISYLKAKTFGELCNTRYFIREVLTVKYWEVLADK